MSQPFDRGCRVPAPGEPDESLGEFWVGNPWFIPLHHNLSCFERNRTFLNLQGRDFVDVSTVAGTDTDGDSRCAVAADLNLDGRLELLVRQAGGGALLAYENRWPQRNWLTISLRGRQSNRLGIGARIHAVAGDLQLTREMYPYNSYMSQSPCRVHLGLADATEVDRLEVQWPSGRVQTLEGIAPNRHIVITEGTDFVQEVEAGKRIWP